MPRTVYTQIALALREEMAGNFSDRTIELPQAVVRRVCHREGNRLARGYVEPRLASQRFGQALVNPDAHHKTVPLAILCQIIGDIGRSIDGPNY